MKKLIIGTKAEPRVKVGNSYFPTVNITAETIKKKVESKLKDLVKVQVFWDKEQRRYSNITHIYITKKQLNTKAIKLRMIPPYLMKNHV